MISFGNLRQQCRSWAGSRLLNISEQRFLSAAKRSQSPQIAVSGSGWREFLKSFPDSETVTGTYRNFDRLLHRLAGWENKIPDVSSIVNRWPTVELNNRYGFRFTANFNEYKQEVF